MDDADRKAYESRSHDLRLQLKQWETTWASSHYGKKPSREDIKKNPDIASKYKKYNRIRDTLSGKIPPPPPPAFPASGGSGRGKRKAGEKGQGLGDATPSKRLKPTETPSNNRVANLSVTPSISRKLFSPNAPTSIGPTPQRDGKVLGLFDLLAAENAAASTPSKTGRDSGIELATPVKGRGAGTAGDGDGGGQEDMEEEEKWGRKMGRTPMSSGKRNYLNNFMTPLKKDRGRRARGQGGLDGIGEGHDDGDDDNLDGVARLFMTPTFLKRHGSRGGGRADTLAEEFKSPDLGKKLPRKPLGRTLSSMVAGLRKMEDEKLDDEMDMLREMEDEPAPAAAKPTNVAKPALAAGGKENEEPINVSGSEGGEDVEAATTQPPTKVNAIPASILVKDTTALLSGFDDEGLYDSEEEESIGRNGQTLRVFKKKGQKRTTRKVNMRPVRARRPVTKPVTSSATVAADEDDEVIPETQCDITKDDEAHGDEIDDFVASGSEFGGGDSDDDLNAEEALEKAKKGRAAAKSKAPAKAPTTKAKATAKGKNSQGEEAEDGAEAVGSVKKVARKVNELAHANFRRLKLRNKGGKGGPGHGSRFRRRR